MKMRTAVVDDDRIFHFLMEIMLKESKISNSPVCLLEGAQFLQWWHKHKNDSEATLIFLDLNMPLVDGWHVLDKLRDEKEKNIFIIIITSSIDPKDRKRAEAYPMVIDFMVKPIHLDDLIGIKQSAPLLQYF